MMSREELDQAMSYWDRYTQEQLSQAFALVKNQENWKYPVDATVPADADTALIGDAVIYFTGSNPEFIKLPGGKMRVVAAGYYACVGS